MSWTRSTSSSRLNFRYSRNFRKRKLLWIRTEDTGLLRYWILECFRYIHTYLIMIYLNQNLKNVPLIVFLSLFLPFSLFPLSNPPFSRCLFLFLLFISSSYCLPSLFLYPFTPPPLIIFCGIIYRLLFVKFNEVHFIRRGAGRQPSREGGADLRGLGSQRVWSWIPKALEWQLFWWKEQLTISIWIK